MKTVTIECFQIGEWDDETRARIIDKHRDINTDYNWWDWIYEDAKTVGALMGIEIENIYWSGFWSQGDGACFEGRWTFKADAVEAVKAHAPQDEELHRIAAELIKYGQDLTASVNHRGHYYHELSTEIDFDWLIDVPSYAATREQLEFLKDALRDFMRWIYRSLEAEYEYRTGDEAVFETLEANEYEFDHEGRIW